MRTIEQRLEAIEQRNRSVELDKKWETSSTRKILIVSFTYILLGSYMWAIGVDNPLLNAVIPTLGFTLSTLSFSFFRRIWEKKQSFNKLRRKQ